MIDMKRKFSVLFVNLNLIIRSDSKNFYHLKLKNYNLKMREIVHIQAGQCGNQIGAKVISFVNYF